MPHSNINILVLSQALDVQQAVASALGELGLPTLIASTAEEVQKILGRLPVSLIFCSDELPGSCVDNFVRQAKRPPWGVPVVVVQRVGEWERYLHFLNAGAFDCVVYPLHPAEVERITRNVLGLFQPEKARQQIAGAA